MENNEFQKKMGQLLFDYTKNLPNKIDELDIHWKNLCEVFSQIEFQEFHREVHNLCGSAATYGYPEVGNSARFLEIKLKSLLDTNLLNPIQKKEISKLLDELKLVVTISTTSNK